MKLSIDPKVIASIILFASKDKNRPSIQGINFEVGAKQTLITATDGAILGCFRVITDTDKSMNFTLPTELFANIKARGGWVQIVINEDISTIIPITVSQDSKTIFGNPIDIKYPDWRKNIPKTVSGEAGQFNLSLFAPFVKTCQIMSGNKNAYSVSVGWNGDNVALVSIGKEFDFIGLAAPFRAGSIHDTKDAPEWVL